MTVVIDASLLVSLAANDPRAEAVNEMFAGWHASGEALHAPALAPFEVANGLTRLVAGGALPADRVEPAWQAVQGRPIIYHQLRDAPPVIRLARQLERHSAYDAAHLNLAQERKPLEPTPSGPASLEARSAARSARPPASPSSTWRPRIRR